MCRCPQCGKDSRDKQWCDPAGDRLCLSCRCVPLFRGTLGQGRSSMTPLTRIMFDYFSFCSRQLDPDAFKRAADDSDDDFEPAKKAPAARAGAGATQGKGKRKAEGPPEVLEILDDDEDAQYARAVAASEEEAAAKKRPQRKAAQDAESLSTQLLGLKGAALTTSADTLRLLLQAAHPAPFLSSRAAFFPSPADPEAVEVSAKDLSYLEVRVMGLSSSLFHLDSCLPPTLLSDALLPCASRVTAGRVPE